MQNFTSQINNLKTIPAGFFPPNIQLPYGLDYGAPTAPTIPDGSSLTNAQQQEDEREDSVCLTF
jgi:hypothetical protein